MYKRPIIYIDNCIAFTDELGNIYINKHLKAYNKDLYKKVLAHERAHKTGKYGKEDFYLDLDNNISQFDLIRFCLRYPKGFLQNIPIWKVNDIWFYSWTGILRALIIILISLMTLTFIIEFIRIIW